MADDYAASSSTTGVVQIGGSTTGIIETAGDNDWFAVSLTAGQTYQFRLNATSNLSSGGVSYSALGNPILALSQYQTTSSGSKAYTLAFDDNSGTSNGTGSKTSNNNSLITYTPTTSGTYYLGARDYSSSNTGGYTVSAALATSPTLAIASGGSSYEGNSGTTPFTFTVTRSGSTTAAASVAWAVSSNSSSSYANASDFVGGVLPSGTVTFAAGQSTATITVNVAGDRTSEPNEYFTVVLSNPVGATLQTLAESAEGYIKDDDGTTKAKVFVGTNDAVTVSENGATLVGNLGSNTLKLASTVAGVTVDANFSRIELAGNLADYLLVVYSGIGLQIQKTDGTVVSTFVSLNADVKLAFANGSATLAQTGITAFSLGGQAISTTTPTAMSVALTSTDTSSFTTSSTRATTKSLVYMGTNDTFTVSENGATLIGNLGSNTAKIALGVTGVKTDANFARIELAGNLSDYKLGVIPGTGLQIQTQAGVAIDTIVSLNADTTLAFANGSATLAQTGITAFSLGGQTISTTTPATMSVTLNSSDTSTFTGSSSSTTSAVSVSATGSSSASSGNITYNVHPTSSFTYTVSGFSAGDKLVFDTGTSFSVTNTSSTDGIIDVSGSLSGQTVVIHLTGIAVASDTPFNSTTFNTVFGTGSLA